MIDSGLQGFVLATLAVWRITHLLACEDGPFDVVFRVRRAAGASIVGQALDCFYCLSLWVAVPFAWWLGAEPLGGVTIWLALSGAASLLFKVSSQQTKGEHS